MEFGDSGIDVLFFEILPFFFSLLGSARVETLLHITKLHESQVFG